MKYFVIDKINNRIINYNNKESLMLAYNNTLNIINNNKSLKNTKLYFMNNKNILVIK